MKPRIIDKILLAIVLIHLGLEDAEFIKLGLLGVTKSTIA